MTTQTTAKRLYARATGHTTLELEYCPVAGMGSRNVVADATREHEKFEFAARKARAALSNHSWRKVVRERIRWRDDPAISAHWPAIY